MFNLKKVYLSVSIDETKTVVLAAEHNDERMSVLASDTFMNGNMVGCVSATTTAIAIRRFDVYVDRLHACFASMAKRIGLKFTGFVLVLPTGNFDVTTDARDRIYALPSGVVSNKEIQAALNSPLDQKNLTPCLTVPYNFSLDEEAFSYAPLRRDGSSLMVQRAHYVMTNQQTEPFFNLASALDLNLLKIMPAGLSRLNECCDKETLRTGVLGVHINASQTGLNMVRSGFERSLLEALPFGKNSVMDEVARSLNISVEAAVKYASGISLYETSQVSVFRTFEEHYSVVSDITIAQIASSLRTALSLMLQQLKRALSAKRFANVLPSSFCFTGFFCDLPGFKRLAAEVFGEEIMLLIPQTKVVGARSSAYNETLGSVRIMAQLNAMIAAKEYSVEPYESEELVKQNVRKQRVLFAGRMAAKALEGVLGNK